MRMFFADINNILCSNNELSTVFIILDRDELGIGIGFTMSLFISGLAFKNPEFMDQAKYNILIASVIAGILGTLVLKKVSKSC
jgi:Na+/H+ antiporter NhaA